MVLAMSFSMFRSTPFRGRSNAGGGTWVGSTFVRFVRRLVVEGEWAVGVLVNCEDKTAVAVAVGGVSGA